ncbi:hypothetical protein PROFUN_04021 [Planoprotostelium fungivorum]|uniref:Macrophage erythroblast attacher n=1 Tax=Planoprotostelium fungivorum TaxID=1890364 RepID=A0A2P6NWE0_9EUKA|nr:hypothetical protein PROFUN_14923 [Planoprotostelium fungivorum]PRP88198.1 hypothetical protein PROFUN_04021 [Planoprotostelium fungivorum]
MELEQAFLRAPYESLNRSFRRSQKNIEKEIAQVVKEVNDMSKAILTRDQANNRLDKLTGKLNNLKRKLEENKREEIQHIERCKKRMQHLAEYSGADLREVAQDDTKRRWHKIRLDRMMVDYLMKQGHYQTAIQLAKESNIEELVDLDIFLSAKRVVDRLKEGDCKEGLKWCNDNRSKLKKIQSTLEFSLRTQEFIELVRSQSYLESIQHARKYFQPAANEHMKEIQSVMATLAFLKDTKCPKYQGLFGRERWQDIIQQFERENYQLFGITEIPYIDINLQSGLSAMKTSFCYEEESRHVDCPVCSSIVGQLGKDLPEAHHTHSSLVCRISGKVMSDSNPPLALPNGNAYSRDALLSIANNNEGKVTDPRTKETFSYGELKRLYIS